MQMGVFYFVSPRVTRSLAYGLAARNRLDMYRPPAKRERPPNGYRVVIYITGSHHLQETALLKQQSGSSCPHLTVQTCARILCRVHGRACDQVPGDASPSPIS